jgi:antitoxin HicB
MEAFNYPVVLAPAAEGGFVVRIPDVPEALTQGENEQDALARAVDALETALEMYMAEGDPLPVPGKAKRRQRTVTPTALAVLKLSIYSAMVKDKVRKTELARRLGMHLMQIDRLLDLHHASRIDQLELALRALNRKVSIRVHARAA